MIKLIEKTTQRKLNRIKFRELFKECKNNVQKLYPHIDLSNVLLDESQYFDENNCWGKTFINNETYDTYPNCYIKISFNYRIVDLKYFDYSLSTIYHELCHALTSIIIIKQLYKKRISFEQSSQLLFQNKGHSKLWFKVAWDINLEFNLTFPIIDKISNKDLKEISKDYEKENCLTLYCNSCHKSQIFYLNDQTIKDLNNPESNLSNQLLKIGLLNFEKKLGKEIYRNNLKAGHITLCPYCKSKEDVIISKISQKLKRFMKHITLEAIKTYILNKRRTNND